MANKKQTETAGHVFGRSLLAVVDSLQRQNIIITAVKVKFPGIAPLAVLQARTTEGPMIAFVSAEELDQLGRLLHKKHQEGSLRWKQDEWEIRRLAGDEGDL
jgi:hypothetical protein